MFSVMFIVVVVHFTIYVVDCKYTDLFRDFQILVLFFYDAETFLL